VSSVCHLMISWRHVILGRFSVNACSAPAKELRSGEKFTFKAEVNRLMDIIIHSLYSNKDIFLRELISNASDALNKIRLLSLSEPSKLGSGTASNLEIRMEIDKDKNILKIRDRGIGMSKDELVNNLGTIAKSGTSAFLDKMQQGGDVNLIGQFGVGFYSVYLVSDYVEVISKPHDGIQHIWESKAGGEFVITEDKNGDVSGEGDLERGSMIRIHLKEENMEYAQESRLKSLVQKYSEFINFPIYLLTSKEVEVQDDSGAPARLYTTHNVSYKKCANALRGMRAFSSKLFASFVQFFHSLFYSLVNAFFQSCSAS
jgi:heat shock protein 90kDa beta